VVLAAALGLFPAELLVVHHFLGEVHPPSPGPTQLQGEMGWCRGGSRSHHLRGGGGAGATGGHGRDGARPCPKIALFF
jgi:hypothetical protein